MNRAAKFAIAATFLSLATAGASRAEGLGMNGSGTIEQTIRTFNGHFNIEQVYNWHNLPDERDGPRSAPVRTAADLQVVRASIAENPALHHKLAEDGVNLRNVVNVQQALDGSLTFYVR